MNENGCVGLSTLMGLQWPHKIPSCVPTEKGGAPESRPKSGVREAKRTMLGEAQRLNLRGEIKIAHMWTKEERKCCASKQMPAQ